MGQGQLRFRKKSILNFDERVAGEMFYFGKTTVTQ
jgi:hypothetical protein